MGETKFTTVALGILGAAAVFWSGEMYGQAVVGAPAVPPVASHAPSAPAPVKATDPPPAAVNVSAVNLENQWLNNTIAAEEDYGGKIVDLSGSVYSVGVSSTGTPYVQLNAGGGPILTVYCYFPNKARATLAALKVQENVVLEGTVAAGDHSLSVKGCRVVSAGRAP